MHKERKDHWIFLGERQIPSFFILEFQSVKLGVGVGKRDFCTLESVNWAASETNKFVNPQGRYHDGLAPEVPGDV